MKAPSLVTEMHYDITCGPGDVCWEERTWTQRTGERQAFKTVDSADKDSTGCLFFKNIFLFLIPAKHLLLKMHVLYAGFDCLHSLFYSQA